MPIENCEHKNFEANTIVTRLVEKVGDTNVNNYMLEITVKCKDCGLPFRFMGLSQGLSFTRPMMAPFGSEARLPIAPSNDPVDQLKSIWGQ